MISRLSFWCIMIACVGSAATVQAENAAVPDIHVGDRWVYQHIDGMTNEPNFSRVEDVVEVSGSAIRTRIRIKGKQGQDLLTYTPEWNPTDIASAQFTPSLKLFTFPLDVGKKWDGKADKRIFKTGDHGTLYSKGEVLGLEKVTVPAGSFDAYKIHVSLDGSSNMEDAQTGHTEEVYWYVPAVKRFVRLESKFTKDGSLRSDDILELQEFTLR